MTICDIKKFNITLMAIFVTHIYSLHIVYMLRIRVTTKKLVWEFCENKYFFHPSKTFRVPRERLPRTTRWEPLD